MATTASTLRTALLSFLPALTVLALGTAEPGVRQDPSAKDAQGAGEEKAIEVQYLELVTPDVDAMCGALATLHGVTFSDPVAEFGNARTAALEGGGLLGVRAPMRADEEPVVRPYVLVEDIEAAVEAARAAGGEIALPPMEIPERGTFAIYIHGGIQHGLWEI